MRKAGEERGLILHQIDRTVVQFWTVLTLWHFDGLPSHVHGIRAALGHPEHFPGPALAWLSSQSTHVNAF